jgi:hypothetical protein
MVRRELSWLNAALTGNINKRFGIVADFSGHYGSDAWIGSSQTNMRIHFCSGRGFLFVEKD